MAHRSFWVWAWFAIYIVVDFSFRKFSSRSSSALPLVIFISLSDEVKVLLADQDVVRRAKEFILVTLLATMAIIGFRGILILPGIFACLFMMLSLVCIDIWNRNHLFNLKAEILLEHKGDVEGLQDELPVASFEGWRLILIILCLVELCVEESVAVTCRVGRLGREDQGFVFGK